MPSEVKQMMFGMRPIHRTERRAGQSEWYYLDPRYKNSDDGSAEIDVDSPETLNPYANEIQNYLYKNDSDNYQDLYGDSIPPAINSSFESDNNTQPQNENSGLSNSYFSQPFSNNGDFVQPNAYLSNSYNNTNNPQMQLSVSAYPINENQLIQNKMPYYNSINDNMNLGNNTTDRINNAIKKSIISEGLGEFIADAQNQGFFYAANNFFNPSLRKAYSAYERMNPLRIDDTYKHQYVSCVGSTGGIVPTGLMLTGGLVKEGLDFITKSLNSKKREQYNGFSGIFKDNLKDMSNNLIGAWEGLTSYDPNECEKLLPEKYRNKNPYSYK